MNPQAAKAASPAECEFDAFWSRRRKAMDCSDEELEPASGRRRRRFTLKRSDPETARAFGYFRPSQHWWQCRLMQRWLGQRPGEGPCGSTLGSERFKVNLRRRRPEAGSSSSSEQSIALRRRLQNASNCIRPDLPLSQLADSWRRRFGGFRSRLWAGVFLVIPLVANTQSFEITPFGSFTQAGIALRL